MVFAQANPMGAFQWVTVGLMIASVVAVFVLIVIGLFMLYFRRNRQLLHLERMRAIEMGQPFEAPEAHAAHDKSMHNTFWIAFWMGFGVPAAVFSAAAKGVSDGALGLGIAIWASAAAASVAAVICATALMVRCVTGQRSNPEQVASFPATKTFAKPGTQ